MSQFSASRKQLLVPVLLTIVFVALLLFLLNIGVLRAQDDATPDANPASNPAVDFPAGDIPIETPYYLPMVGSAGASAGDVIPGEYIVVLQPADVRAANGEARSVSLFAADVVNTYGGDILFTYDVALDGFAAALPLRAVASLGNDPSVAYLEPNRVVLLDATQSPATWGIDRIDQRNRPLSNSYTYDYTGAGVHAYIIDTGILGTHSQFTGRVGGGYTAITDGRGTGDCNGHGTHVSGTVGGSTWGVAKEVTIHPVRVLNCQGSGSNAGVIAGINWVAANRANPAVINMSLGGGVSAALDSAVSAAVASGVTVVVAAGNANANACNSSPSRAPSAITVGATTSSDARASYSNFGTCLDIFAPGTSIQSAWNTNDTAVNIISGTSMASPHVAGAVALYLQANPGASPAAVVAALTGNATANVISSVGNGSPNRLLFTGFISGSPLPTATFTNTPTNTPTKTPTNTPVAGPTATNTPVPTATNTPVPTNTPIPAATNTPVPPSGGQLIANGNFESGRTVWTESSLRGYTLICSTTGCGPAGVAPHGGSWLAWLAGANSETSEIRQTVALPAGSTPTLSFWYWSDSNDWCGYDYGYVNLIVNGTTIQLRRYNLCASTDTNGWVQQQFNLAAYAGSTVTLAFRATTDVSWPSHLFIDDVSVATGVTAAEAEEPDNLIIEGDVPALDAKPSLPAAEESLER